MLPYLVFAIALAAAKAQCPQPNFTSTRWPRDVDAYAAETEIKVATVNQTFDCQMRQLAFQYAYETLPWISQRSPATLAEALQLSETSGCTIPAPAAAEGAERDVQAAPASSYAEATAIYVSTSGSDSAGDGSKDKPFATPERAAKAVAAIPRPLAAPVEVNLGPGVYGIPEGLVLDQTHSGQGQQFPVSWQTDSSSTGGASPKRRFDGADSERAVLSGASALGRLDWKPDASAMQKPSVGWMNIPLHHALQALQRSDAATASEFQGVASFAGVAEEAASSVDLPASLTTAGAEEESAGWDVFAPASTSGAYTSADACASWCTGTWTLRGRTSPLCVSWAFFPATGASVLQTLAELYGPSSVGPPTSAAVPPMPAICVGRSSNTWSPVQSFRAASSAPSSAPSLRASGGADLPVVSGPGAPVYSAVVPPSLLPAGRTIRSLYFNGTGAANRFTLARFPNGNDTVPPPAGYIEANGGFPTDPSPSGTVASINVSVLINGMPLTAGVAPTGFAHKNVSVSAPLSEPLAVYPKGSCTSFRAVSGGSLSRYITDQGLVPFWNSAVCQGMYYSSSSFSPRSWKNASEARVTMFQTHTWGNWGFTVASRDDSQSSLTFSGGGFQEARGGGINKQKSGHGPEGGGNKFFVDGVQEELDAVGEFYFDSTTSTLMVVPLDDAMAAALPWTEFWAPMAANVVTIRGSSSDPAAFQALKDIDVTHSAEQFYDGPFEAPPGGDWALVRRGAIKLDGVDSVAVEDVSVLSPGSNGIVLTNRASRTNVTGCLVQDAGESGVLIIGTTQLMDGYSEQSQPANSLISGNYVHDVGRIGKQAAPIFIGISRGIALENNVLHTGPRAGINLNDPYGGGHSIRGNLLFATCRSTWDHGAINSWGREPFIYPDASTPTGLAVTPSQTDITHNFLINHNYGPGHPNSDKLVDLDDGSTSFSVNSNVLLYGGVKFRDGRFRTGYKNLILFPETQNSSFSILPGMYLGPMGKSVNAYYSRVTDSFYDNTVLSSTGSFYSCSSGWDASNFPNMTTNTFITPDAASLPFDASGCGGTFKSFKQWQDAGHDAGSTITSSVDFNDVISQAKELLSM